MAGEYTRRVSDANDRFEVDAGESRVVIHTFAEGLFAKLAHDLELVARVSGHATRSRDAEGTFELEVPVSSIEVVGARKGGVVDAGALSASDKGEILAKMREDVFRSGASADGAVRITGELAAGNARAKIEAPRGASTRVDAKAQAKVDGERADVTLSFGVSLAALGSAPVKGPMGAFRVKDTVQITAELVLRRA